MSRVRSRYITREAQVKYFLRVFRESGYYLALPGTMGTLDLPMATVTVSRETKNLNDETETPPFTKVSLSIEPNDRSSLIFLAVRCVGVSSRRRLHVDRFIKRR